MTTAIVTVVMFLVLVSLHEFGHFIFGKMLGFRVLEYAIGFGPAIYKKQTKDTLYSFRIVPFGGFCKFAGEDEQSKAEDGNFNEQSCFRRVLVLVAGALFNIILGFILFVVLTASSKSYYTSTINKVVENSHLEETGVQVGDKITKLNGKNVGMFQEISLYTQGLTAEDKIDMTVKRNGENINLTFYPTKQEDSVEYLSDGVRYVSTTNGNAEEKMISYSDQLPYDADLVGKIQSSSRFIIGFEPTRENITITNVIPQSFRMTKFVVKLLYRSIWEMATGKMSMDQVSGPVGVVNEVNTAVHSGSDSWKYVLNLVALLTINLGVFNLLPLPALDGGRLVFVIIEWVRGKPVSPEKEGWIHGIGFLLLLALMAFVSYRDIVKLFIK